MWLEAQWPGWLEERDDARKTKVSRQAGIEYVDLGEAFAQQAYDTYWEFLTRAEPRNGSGPAHARRRPSDRGHYGPVDRLVEALALAGGRVADGVVALLLCSMWRCAIFR